MQFDIFNAARKFDKSYMINHIVYFGLTGEHLS